MENKELEEFLSDVEKFNENISSDIPSDEKNSFENPLENIEQPENDTENKSEPETQNEKRLEELREGLKKIIDGYAFVKLVDSVFPKTLIYLLSFIDKDFRKINLKNVQLDDEEIEIYKPLGDYVAEYILTKLNPIVLLCSMYAYRTTLAITIEYNKVKSMSNHIKKHAMPLKKHPNITEKKFLKRRERIFRESDDFSEENRINRRNIEYIKELKNELENKNAEIQRLNNSVEELRREFLNYHSSQNPVQKENEPEKIDRRKIIDDEKKRILKERLAKAREIRKMKLQEQKNESNGQAEENDIQNE
jgi:hypothetical protein